MSSIMANLTEWHLFEFNSTDSLTQNSGMNLFQGML